MILECKKHGKTEHYVNGRWRECRICKHDRYRAKNPKPEPRRIPSILKGYQVQINEYIKIPLRVGVTE